MSISDAKLIAGAYSSHHNKETSFMPAPLVVSFHSVILGLPAHFKATIFHWPFLSSQESFRGQNKRKTCKVKEVLHSLPVAKHTTGADPSQVNKQRSWISAWLPLGVSFYTVFLGLSAWVPQGDIFCWAFIGFLSSFRRENKRITHIWQVLSVPASSCLLPLYHMVLVFSLGTSVNWFLLYYSWTFYLGASRRQIAGNFLTFSAKF